MTNDKSAEEIVRELRDMLPEKVDYAELVASPVPSSYGVCFVWDSPEPYMISAAADLIETQATEIAELRERVAELEGRLSEITQIALDVTSKYETSVKMHGLTTELLNASQQRERAAVEAICENCRALADRLDKTPTCESVWSREDCKWRGPQKAGEESR